MKSALLESALAAWLYTMLVALCLTLTASSLDRTELEAVALFFPLALVLEVVRARSKGRLG